MATAVSGNFNIEVTEAKTDNTMVDMGGLADLIGVGEQDLAHFSDGEED